MKHLAWSFFLFGSFSLNQQKKAHEESIDTQKKHHGESMGCKKTR